MKATDQDKVYRELILEPLRKCADYTPKFGQGQGENGYTLEDFERVYGADPLYSWIGFDSPLMYAAHKAAGGMTSLYRQLGIGCERLFRQVIRDQLGLTAEQANWSYEVAEESGTVRTLYLDGRILLQDIQSTVAKKRVATWLKEMRAKLKILTPIEGAVFEVRQGYKSKDSKRQNADLHNAAQAIAEKYIPVLNLISASSCEGIIGRTGIYFSAIAWAALCKSAFCLFESLLLYPCLTSKTAPSIGVRIFSFARISFSHVATLFFATVLCMSCRRIRPSKYKVLTVPDSSATS